jgi:anthranilate 1,2-dioxygenase ferredoxin component
MKEIVIELKEQFVEFPVEIQIEGKPYFLIEEEAGYTLMSRICPHAGDTVDLEDGELVCPMHGWTFEVHTGRCHNVPSAKLKSYEVDLREGNLIALMP